MPDAAWNPAARQTQLGVAAPSIFQPAPAHRLNHKNQFNNADPFQTEAQRFTAHSRAQAEMMNVLDGGCFMALSDALVAVDLRTVGELAKLDLKARCNALGDAPRLDACLMEKTKAGLWYAFAIVESSGCEIDENRVAALICIADNDLNHAMISPEYLLGMPWQDVRVAEGSWHSDQVNVGCGSVGLLCMESVRTCAKTHGLTVDDDAALASFLRSWANAMCQATTTCKVCLANIPNGPIGAICAAGICDNGTYCCQVVRDDVTDEVSAFKVTFPAGV